MTMQTRGGDVEEEYLTVPEIAQRLKLSEETVRRWCRAGKLRGTVLSDAAGWRVAASEVARVLRPDPVEQGGERA